VVWLGHAAAVALFAALPIALLVRRPGLRRPLYVVAKWACPILGVLAMGALAETHPNIRHKAGMLQSPFGFHVAEVIFTAFVSAGVALLAAVSYDTIAPAVSPKKR
jgi:hypothetical protein